MERETPSIFSTRKAASFFIISLIISLPAIFALEISFDSPSSVKVNEEFGVTIKADSDETYDVKIFVHTSEDKSIARGEYISEIFQNGEWKDSWFYLKESFPEEKEFKIRVLSSSGERKICTRLRKTSTQSTSINCKEIIILQEEEKVEEIVPSKKDEFLTQQAEEEKPEEQPKKEQPLQQLSEKTTEKILLNSPEQAPFLEITTKKEKTRTGILYSFIFLITAILIFLALRRL